MLKYIGKGQFISGFPAKNLTEKQVLDCAMKMLLQSGLYAYEERSKPKPSEDKGESK